MISWFLEGANVRKVVRKVTLRLVAHFGEKQHYSEQEVVFAYTESMSNRKYLDFALAMYCSLNEFGNIQQKYTIMRTQSQYHALIGRYCFGGWPRFNTQTLIDYANGKLHTSPGGH